MTVPSFWSELLHSLGLPPKNFQFFSHFLSCTCRQLPCAKGLKLSTRFFTSKI